jgi:hypothetical protein
MQERVRQNTCDIEHGCPEIYDVTCVLPGKLTCTKLWVPGIANLECNNNKLEINFEYFKDNLNTIFWLM